MKYKCLAMILWLLCASTVAFGVSIPYKIDKAFESLKSYNYFAARKFFEKSTKKFPCLSNFGLSIIFFRTDNPFHQIDSAYSRINSAILTYNQSGKQELKKLQQLKIDFDSLSRTQEAISNLAFSNAIIANDTASLNHFIEVYTSSADVNRATHFRDSLAFEYSRSENSSESYQQYMIRYPNSYLFNEARVRYELTLYKESVFDGSENSYAKFIAAYPQSPHVGEAMLKVYELSTGSSNDPDSYHQFILNYPDYVQVEDAWQRIYDLCMVTFNEEAILTFKNRYPDYPFQEKLNDDLRLSLMVLLPFQEDQLFGLIGTDGAVVVEPRYNFIGKFVEGIAVISLNGKMGYISKSGEEIVPPFFDDAENFHNNLAIVGERGKYGVIKRNGQMVVPLSYFEIGDFSDGLAAAYDENFYGFINRTGSVIIPFRYQSASEFRNGMSICQLEDSYGLINITGNVIIPFQFDALEWFEKDILKILNNDRVGLINTDGLVLLTCDYDEIGPLSDGKIVVIKNGKLGFADLNGNIIIPLTFDAGKDAITRSQFYNNFAVVGKKHKFGVIDTSGNTILPFMFEDIGLIDDSLAAFRKNGKWGLQQINSGKIIFQPEFDRIVSCTGGSCIVVLRGKYGLTDFKRKVILPYEYEFLSDLGQDLFLAGKSGKFGVVNISNQELVPFLYDKYREIESGFIEFSDGTISLWLDVVKKRIFSKI